MRPGARLNTNPGDEKTEPSNKNSGNISKKIRGWRKNGKRGKKK